MFIPKADRRLQGIWRSKACAPMLMNLEGPFSRPVSRTVGLSSLGTPGLIKQLLRWGRTAIQYMDFEGGAEFWLVHALFKANQCLCQILYSWSIAKAFLLELFQPSYQGCQIKVALPRIFCTWGSHGHFEVMTSVGKEGLHCDGNFRHPQMAMVLFVVSGLLYHQC